MRGETGGAVMPNQTCIAFSQEAGSRDSCGREVKIERDLAWVPSIKVDLKVTVHHQYAAIGNLRNLCASTGESIRSDSCCVIF
jgi:hypothetical protein